MKKKSLSIIRLLAATLVLSFVVIAVQTSVVAAKEKTFPPFMKGHVVLQGQPENLPGDFTIIKYLHRADLTIIAVEPGKEWAQIQSLRAKGYRAYLNLKAKAFLTPNDQLYSYQWHFPLIKSEAAWDISTGSNVVVAVLDTGLKTDGALDGITCVRSNGVDIVNTDTDPTDGDGHGTHVSGTIAQTTSNEKGVAGLAHGACILPVKVLNDEGSGSFADIAEGVYYAVDNGANVINLSLGTNARFIVRNDPIMDPALDYANAHNVTVVCASGNDGVRKNVSYPAIYPTTIAVGATDFNSEVTRYSNKGEGLDIVAPGGDTSTDLNGDGYGDGVLQETCINGSWGYYFFQGTSMASPHVAAVAAMLYASGIATDPDSVYAALTSTALDLEDAGYDKVSGYGLVQAHNALTYAGCFDYDKDGFTTCGGDCDDNNSSIYPGADEICDDGIDNNCDGSIDGDDDACSVTCTDADGDGWCVEEGDCNDGDASINPGEAEVCGDGIDNNCDGSIDEGCGDECLPNKATCSSDTECCSGKCHPIKGTCL